MESFISLVMMFFQSEANILSEVAEITLNARVLLKGVQISEIGEHFILEPFEPNVRNSSLQIISFQSRRCR